MKKILSIIVAAICLASCGDYYYEESRAKRSYYATDSTECVVEGIWGLARHPYLKFSSADGPPPAVSAVVTSNATYYHYHQWQTADYGPQPIEGPHDSIANTVLNVGDRIRAYGIVRKIASLEGESFQDILIDSVEVLKSIYRYTDTVENIVIKGKYTGSPFPKLSDYHNNISHPCIYLPSPSKIGEIYIPNTIHWINTAVNFEYDRESYNGAVYLCGVHVQLQEWVEVHCTRITGLDMYDEPYWIINMDSVKHIPTPDAYKE